MKGALVTGAGQRIGRALAMALAADGFFVFVHHHRSAAAARETVAAITAAGGKAKAVKADLSSANQAEASGRPLPGAGCQAHLPREQRLAVRARPRAHGDGRRFRPSYGGEPARAAAVVAGTGAAAAGQGDRPDRERARPETVQPQPGFPHAIRSARSACRGLTTLLAQSFAPRLRVAGIAPGLTLRSGSQTDARFAEQHRQNPLGVGVTHRRSRARATFCGGDADATLATS